MLGTAFFKMKTSSGVLRIKYGGKLESMFMEAYNEKVYAAKKIRGIFSGESICIKGIYYDFTIKRWLDWRRKCRNWN